MNLKVLFCLALLTLLFTACKNDVDLNAPYKEIPSIYAVLDPTAGEQMIRINKVFLGEGDANQMAKVSDSVNYPANELVVKLERFVNGKKTQASLSRYFYADSTDIFFTERMIETQAGSFSTSQRVYVTNHKLFEDGEYRLTVTNLHTGNKFTAKANSVKPVSVSTFSPLGYAPYYPYPPTADPKTAYIDYSIDAAKTPYEIRYTTNEAYFYQLILRFHVLDSIGTGNAPTERLIDYNAGTHSIRDAQKLGSSGTSYISHTFGGAGIFATMGTEIAKYPLNIVGRRINYLEYIIFSSNIEYSDYLDYIKPSLSLNQNKPLYSNFDNAAALGLFTFRTHKSVLKQTSTTYNNRFSDHPSTCQYKFFDQFWVVRGCKP